MPVQGAYTPPPRSQRPRPPAVSTDRTIGAQRLSQTALPCPPVTLSRPRRRPRRQLPRLRRRPLLRRSPPAPHRRPRSAAAQRRHHRRPRPPPSQPARNYSTFNDIASRAEAAAADRSTSIGKICSLHRAHLERERDQACRRRSCRAPAASRRGDVGRRAPLGSAAQTAVHLRGAENSCALTGIYMSPLEPAE
jgi:hypothetical protein